MLAFSTLACPEWSFAEAIDAAVRFGYGGVELRVINSSTDLLAESELQGTRLAESARRAADAGVRVVGIGTGAVLHGTKGNERRAAIENVVAHLELAQKLGASFLRVFGDRVQTGATREHTEGWILEGLDAIATELRGSGVQALLETHGDFAAPDELRFLDATPVLWDPVNAFVAHGTAPLLSTALNVQHVHVKDVRRGPAGAWNFVVPGTGEFPLQEMREELRRVKYEGAISFEWERFWHKELSPAEDVLPRFVRWAKEAGWA